MKPKPGKSHKKHKGVKSKAVGKAKKASFKHGGGKKGKLASRKGTDIPATCEATYNGYDITPLPKEAWPHVDRLNRGEYSYTLNGGKNAAVVEVLLSKEAYFIKKCAEGYEGPIGQITWRKFGGPIAAWQIVKERSGYKRWG